jgi:DNA polymerase III subunit epsilon
MDAPEARELPQDLVFVDLETTGGNAAHHRITEIGIVRVEAGVAVEEWSTLVNPECLIPDYIESFTGITNQMVASAPRFADIAPLVLEKLGTARAGAAPLFAAHNARFDYSFLRAEFRRAGVPFSAKVLCTVKLSRRLFPEHVKHSLDAVMERHGLACSARHRALGDARVISDFWLKLSRELPEPQLAAAARSTIGRHKLPVYLPADLPDELPEGPGIYRLYGAGEELLYVGKSASLRTGVQAH